MFLLDIHSERAGNTSARRLGCWRVYIVSVDKERRTAVVRWNVINPEQTWDERRLKCLYMPGKEPKKYREQQERKAKRGDL